jgi:hypothetical protein
MRRPAFGFERDNSQLENQNLQYSGAELKEIFNN